MAKINVAPMVQADRPYILDTFLRSYGKSLYASGTHPDVLLSAMDSLLYLWNCLVAKDPEGNTILGWIVYKDPQTVAWAYVRKLFRDKGVFNSLLNAVDVKSGEIRMAFMPTQSVSFDLQRVWRKGYRLRFKPYLPYHEIELAKREIANPV